MVLLNPIYQVIQIIIYIVFSIVASIILTILLLPIELLAFHCCSSRKSLDDLNLQNDSDTPSNPRDMLVQQQHQFSLRLQATRAQLKAQRRLEKKRRQDDDLEKDNDAATVHSGSEEDEEEEEEEEEQRWSIEASPEEMVGEGNEDIYKVSKFRLNPAEYVQLHLAQWKGSQHSCSMADKESYKEYLENLHSSPKLVKRTHSRTRAYSFGMSVPRGNDSDDEAGSEGVVNQGANGWTTSNRLMNSAGTRQYGTYGKKEPNSMPGIRVHNKLNPADLDTLATCLTNFPISLLELIGGYVFIPLSLAPVCLSIQNFAPFTLDLPTLGLEAFSHVGYVYTTYISNPT